MHGLAAIHAFKSLPYIATLEHVPIHLFLLWIAEQRNVIKRIYEDDILHYYIITTQNRTLIEHYNWTSAPIPALIWNPALTLKKKGDLVEFYKCVNGYIFPWGLLFYFGISSISSSRWHKLDKPFVSGKKSDKTFWQHGGERQEPTTWPH